MRGLGDPEHWLPDPGGGDGGINELEVRRGGQRDRSAGSCVGFRRKVGPVEFAAGGDPAPPTP